MTGRREEMYKKILVPCDGSELAQASIFPQVEDLAKSMNAEVIIVRVVPPPPGRSGSDVARHPIYKDQEMASAEAEARHSVARAEAMFRERGINVRSEVLFGQPAEEIIDYADEEEADLIVMCTHGSSGLRRWVFGSVTDKVLRGAKTPLLVIRPENPGDETAAQASSHWDTNW
jgi:nucleotide-binding universal stress UspA family protein